jgi:signal transduction histidine kinase
MLEYDRSVRPSAELARQRIHPDDRDAVRVALDAAAREGRDFDSEHRFVMPDGDVDGIIRETVGLLRGETMRYDITVRTELAADLPQIVGDRLQLQQVAMNLIVNSIEAMKDVDGLREMVIRSKWTENGQILVAVSDTGIGLPPQLAEQIFDSFFTTKPHGRGMGLRISRSIIESHGGRLWVTGAPGQGATFQFSLPVTSED